MSLSRGEEDGLIIQPMVAAHGDNDAQPDIAEHADRLGMPFPAFTSSTVIGVGPGAPPEAGKGKVPHGLAQGMDAGPANTDGAGGAARTCHGSGAGCTLGGGRIAIPVAMIAQFSHHPGGEQR